MQSAFFVDGLLLRGDEALQEGKPFSSVASVQVGSEKTAWPSTAP